jgi:MurNAc alpha-1-phosphate uridylyltransferase
MKAMILAAGRGERMRPLSDSIPKPLLKVGMQSLIEKQLQAFAAIGIQEVVINVAYHAKKIISELGDGKNYGLKILYSYEENGPYGTGGGIFQALPQLGDDAFLLISSDIWTDLPLENLPKKINNEAHLVMVENPIYHPSGDFCLEKNGTISLNQPKLTYASIAVLHPKLFAKQKPGTYPLAPLLENAIGRGQVTGELYTGSWYNIGTPQQLAELQT